MNMISDDLAAIHGDALALGMATACLYSGTPIVATFAEIPQAYIQDEGAETRRRECSMDVAVSDVAAPAKDDVVTVPAGVYRGAWVVIDVASADDAGWVLTVRRDDRVRPGLGRRLP